MQEVLKNIALVDTINYCKANNIPPNGYNGQGSRIYKYPRKFTYALVESDTGRAIVTVSYYKNRVPSYFVHNTN